MNGLVPETILVGIIEIDKLLDICPCTKYVVHFAYYDNDIDSFIGVENEQSIAYLLTC